MARYEKCLRNFKLTYHVIFTSFINNKDCFHEPWLSPYTTINKSCLVKVIYFEPPECPQGMAGTTLMLLTPFVSPCNLWLCHQGVNIATGVIKLCRPRNISHSSDHVSNLRCACIGIITGLTCPVIGQTLISFDKDYVVTKTSCLVDLVEGVTEKYASLFLLSSE